MADAASLEKSATATSAVLTYVCTVLYKVGLRVEHRLSSTIVTPARPSNIVLLGRAVLQRSELSHLSVMSSKAGRRRLVDAVVPLVSGPVPAASPSAVRALGFSAATASSARTRHESPWGRQQVRVDLIADRGPARCRVIPRQQYDVETAIFGMGGGGGPAQTARVRKRCDGPAHVLYKIAGSAVSGPTAYLGRSVTVSPTSS